MNIEKYSERVRGFIQSAQSWALAEGHQQFTPEHMLKVLLDDDQGMAASLIERAGGRPADARLANDAALAKLPKVSGGNGQLYLSQPIAKVFTTAEEAAKKAGDSFVTVERLLQALAIESSASTSKTLSGAGVTAQSLNQAINDIRKGRTADSASAEEGFDALALLAPTPASTVWIVKVTCLFGPLMGVSWLAFVLSYTERFTLTARLAIVALSAWSGVYALMALTNDAHRLVWDTWEVVPDGSLSRIAYTLGPLGWAQTVFAWTAVTISLGVLLWAYAGTGARSRDLSRWIVAGALVPMALSVSFLVGLGPLEKVASFTRRRHRHRHGKAPRLPFRCQRIIGHDHRGRCRIGFRE